MMKYYGYIISIYLKSQCYNLTLTIIILNNTYILRIFFSPYKNLLYQYTHMLNVVSYLSSLAAIDIPN